MSLPIRGVRHVMAHTISTEPRAALSEDAVEAVQVCTGEFLSLLVSEARQRVAREGRDAVTEADLLTVLNTLGFRGFTDSLKSHLQRCAAEDAQARAAPGKAPALARAPLTPDRPAPPCRRRRRSASGPNRARRALPSRGRARAMRGLRLHLRRPLPPPSPGTPQTSTAAPPRHSPLARCRPRPTRLLRPSPPRACCQRPRPHRSQRRREQFPPWNDARGESQWEHTSGRARVLWAFGTAVRSACAPGSDARHFSWRVHGGSLHPARPRPPQAQPHKRDSICVRGKVL